MNVPQPTDYAPMQAGYVNQALSRGGDIIELLNELKDDTYTFFTQLPPEKADYAYAPGKWTIKETLGHMIDTERVFAYRLLCFARGEKQQLPGFDQDDYAAAATYNTRTLESLATEFRAVREGSLYLVKSLTPGQRATAGNATGYSITANAVLYIMAGHELHHLKIIDERYL